MSKKTPIVAITGASGFLGSTLTEHFLNNGWEVVALVRSTERKAKKGVEYREYDLTANVSPSALKDVDYVVHTAYVKLDAANPYAMAMNIEGAAALIKAAEKASVKQTVFISSMSAHEAAISVYGQQKLAIEKLFLATKKST